MSARVRRAGAIQVHGVTTNHEVVWQIGNGPTRESNFHQVKIFREAISSYQSGVAGMLLEGSVEYVTKDDLDDLLKAFQARNRGETDPLCLSCHRASVVLGLEVCSGCNDHAELRPDIDPDTYELGAFVDEHGFDRTPGQWPTGGAL